MANLITTHHEDAAVVGDRPMMPDITESTSCAWCGHRYDLAGLGSEGVKQHLARCELFLASEPGYNW